MTFVSKEVEFYLDDVLDFIDDCSKREKDTILKHLEIKFDNLSSIEERISELRKILKNEFSQKPTDRTMVILDLIECDVR